MGSRPVHAGWCAATNLVLDPEMLPRESIRTFCVDPNWVDHLIDGGLSLANHYARDDDALRRAIKECINIYMDTAVNGVKPQLPRWGLFLRSVAVSAFPDLKIEAPLPQGGNMNTKEILYMQTLAPDILICLLDRLPGDSTFNSIFISQPHHQQGYELGIRLDKFGLKVNHRAIPAITGQAVDHPTAEQIFEFESEERTKVYDFQTRTLRPDAYMSNYFSTMEDVKARKGMFVWPEEMPPPAALLATQLRTTNLRLMLTVKADFTRDPQDRAPIRLSTGSRPDKKERHPSQVQSGLVHVPTPIPSSRLQSRRNIPHLPTGPRRPIGSPKFALENISVEAAAAAAAAAATIEPLPRNIVAYQPLPVQADCLLCCKPQHASNTLYAAPTSNDLVLDFRADICPSTFEVRIPVALGSGVYPPSVTKAKAEQLAILEIEGVAGNTRIPVVEVISPNRGWVAQCRLAQGSLYSLTADKLPESGELVPPQATQLVMLVVSVSLRFAMLTSPKKTAPFSLQLLFRDVRILIPKDDMASPAPPYTLPSRSLQADLIWRDGQGQLSMRPLYVLVKPAVVASVVSVNSVMDDASEHLTVLYELSCLPPVGTQIHMTLWTRGCDDSMPIQTSIHNFLVPDAEPSQSIFQYEFRHRLERQARPVQMIMAAVDSSSVPIGPESERFIFASRPTRSSLAIRLCWKDGGLHAYWAPRSLDQIPFKVRFKKQALFPGQEYNPEASGDDGKHDFDTARIWDHDKPSIMIDIEVCSTDPTLRAGTNMFMLRVFFRRLPEVPATPMPFATNRATRGKPTHSSHLGAISWCPKEEVIESEVWYWSAARTLTGVRCRRGEDGALEADGPMVDIDGAGCVVPLHGKTLMLAWIGVDGGVYVSTRAGDEFLATTWTTVQIAPPSSASTVGGGTLSVSGRNADSPYAPDNSILWWTGPRGELSGRRWIGTEEAWSDLEHAASAGPGSVRFGPAGSARPAPQIAAVWGEQFKKPYSIWLVFWISVSGDLMATASKEGAGCTTRTIAHSIRAAPNTPLVARTLAKGYGASMSVAVAWVGADGSVYNIYAADIGTAADGPASWLSHDSATLETNDFRLAPHGSARPDTDLCFLSSEFDYGRALVFVGLDGRLNVLSWSQSPGSIRDTSWQVLETKVCRQDSERFCLAGVGPRSKKGISDIFFFAGERGGLLSEAVDLSVYGTIYP